MVSPKVRKRVEKMKKMFYSEVLDKYFDSEKECHKAELQYRIDKETKEKEQTKVNEESGALKETAETSVSNEKKLLSEKIEKANDEVNTAQNEYRLAYDRYKEKVKEIRNDYLNKIEKEQNDLQKYVSAVRDAEEKRYEAYQNFNKKFGTYAVKYSGERAYKEMQKTIAYMNDIFDRFWF